MKIAICEDNLQQQERLTDAIKDWAETRKVSIDILCYKRNFRKKNNYGRTSRFAP